MKKLFVVLALAAASLCSVTGQEAKLMILEKDDTAKLKSAYSQYRAALEQWERAKLDVASKYTVDISAKSSKAPCKVSLGADDLNRDLVRLFLKNGANLLSVAANDQKLPDCKTIEGWGSVDFSVDFRAVVPHNDSYAANRFRPLNSWAGITTNAATSSTLVGTSDALSLTGTDGTTATFTPTKGELQVNVTGGARQDLATKEK